MRVKSCVGMFALMFPVMTSMPLLNQKVAHGGTATTAQNGEGREMAKAKVPSAVFVVSL